MEDLTSFGKFDKTPLGYQQIIEKLLQMCAAEHGLCVAVGILQHALWQSECNSHFRTNEILFDAKKRAEEN